MKILFPHRILLVTLVLIITLRLIHELNNYQTIINIGHLEFHYIIPTKHINQYQSCYMQYSWFNFYLPRCQIYETGEYVLISSSINPSSVKQNFYQKTLKIQAITRETLSGASVKHILSLYYSTIDVYQRFIDKTLAQLPTPTAAVIAVLAIGDTSKFSITARQQLIATGIQSLLSFSYYKLLAIAELLCVFRPKRNGVRREAKAVFIVIVVYLVILGFTVSLLRGATSLILVSVAGRFFRRQSHPLSVFAISVLFLLLLKPFLLFEHSFQFQIATIGGPIFYLPFFRKIFPQTDFFSSNVLVCDNKKGIKYFLTAFVPVFRSLCFVFISLHIFSVPLLFLYNGEVNVVQLLAQFFLLPVFPLLTIVAIAALHGLSVPPLFEPSVKVAATLTNVVSWLTTQLLSTTQFSVHWQFTWSGVLVWWLFALLFLFLYRKREM